MTQDLSGLVSDGGVGSNITSLKVVEQSVDMQRRALLIAAGVLGLVSTLVLGQAMARFLAVRRDDGPILSAVGLTTSQRWRAALVVLAPAVIVGCVVAIPVAAELSRMFPLGVARRAEPDPGFHIDWTALAGRCRGDAGLGSRSCCAGGQAVDRPTEHRVRQSWIDRSQAGRARRSTRGDHRHPLRPRAEQRTHTIADVDCAGNQRRGDGIGDGRVDGSIEHRRSRVHAGSVWPVVVVFGRWDRSSGARRWIGRRSTSRCRRPCRTR